MTETQKEVLRKSLEKKSLQELKDMLEDPKISDPKKDVAREIIAEREGDEYSGTRVKDEHAVGKALPTRKSNYEFNYAFTELELRDKARQLAQVCSEKNRIEDEKKSAMSNFKSKLDGKQSEINLLSNHIETGHELVLKTCLCVYDHEAGLKRYYFEDSLVGEERMSASDYQIEIELN